MNKLRLTVLLLAVCLLAGCAVKPSVTTSPGTAASEEAQSAVESTAGSTKAEESVATQAPFEEHDYAGELQLDLDSETVKLDVTVRSFVDGDTVHFNVPDKDFEDGVLKGRFLALNTPESTGRVEEYGKAASRFTHAKLENAAAILIESDDGYWNTDTTGGRYLVWVWYKATTESPWRNLNIEILQNGLAISNGTGQNRYGQTAMAALNQARTLKLNIYSGQPDPDYFHGDAIELTLRELRCHVSDYDGKKVAFEGGVIRNSSNTAYIEEYDSETGLYQGISVYYGFSLTGTGLDILTAGNRVRIVGTVQYYEAGGYWQIVNVKYRAMKPDEPDNIQQIGEGVEPAYVLTDAKTFADGEVTVTFENSEETFAYAELVMDTSLEMKGLKVLEIHTTADPDSSQNGAMTLSCDCDGTAVTVRTKVLYDENRNLITADAFEGKTIDVKGLIGRYDGAYQIIVFTANDISISN